MNAKRSICFGVLMGLVLSLPASAQANEIRDADATPRWDKETLRFFATLPVQEGGRIKPLDTLAGFQLLRINGRRRCKGLDGQNLTPLEWLLDAVFFPERAAQCKVFLVENGEALDAIGLAYKKRRDRYSYQQLAPVLKELFHLDQQYAHIEAKDRDVVQKQIVNLASNVRDFERLARFLEFSHQTVSAGESKILTELFPDESEIGLAELLPKAHALSSKVTALHHDTSLSEHERTGELEAANAAFEKLGSVAHTSDAVAMIPPPGAREENEEWLTPGEVVLLALQSHDAPTAQIEIVDLLGVAARLKNNPDAFKTTLTQLHEKVVQLAGARGEYDKIELEITFYRAKFFYYSLLLYIVCFLLVNLTWIKPQSTRLRWLALAALTLPTAYLTIGIIMRCVIRGRPPVTTLYESILFITAVAVGLAIVMEYINRQRVALAIAAFLGMAGLFLANKYEAMEGVDTMPSMIAVLDTNFWLSTHVTTITTGYAAGLLAGGVAHIYIIGKLLGLKKDDNAFYESIARMTYGMVCFSFLFSVVGTVLGGIWANYSWGRFWGWDPKENGALMIVLWQLALLHARLGGHIRVFGVCMAAIFGGMVVAFSWFGVNLLGVGLHAYGFTSGTAKALMMFYVIEGIVLLCGAFVGLRTPAPANPAPAFRDP